MYVRSYDVRLYHNYIDASDTLGYIIIISIGMAYVRIYHNNIIMRYIIYIRLYHHEGDIRLYHYEGYVRLYHHEGYIRLYHHEGYIRLCIRNM